LGFGSLELFPLGWVLELVFQSLVFRPIVQVLELVFRWVTGIQANSLGSGGSGAVPIGLGSGAGVLIACISAN